MCLQTRNTFDSVNYSPQKKFVKAMFLHLSVSHSVHGGEGCLQAHAQGEIGASGWGGVSRPIPRGGGWGVWPGGYPGPHPGGSPGQHTGGVQAQARGGGSQHALRKTPPPPPADSYFCRRYASYWNAFLYQGENV